MTDQLGVAYGAVLIVVGLLGYFRRAGLIRLLFGLVLGAWSVYNATNPTRQNNVANLAIAAVLGVVNLLSFLTGRSTLAIILVALSAAQVYRNYPYLK